MYCVITRARGPPTRNAARKCNTRRAAGTRLQQSTVGRHSGPRAASALRPQPPSYCSVAKDGAARRRRRRCQKPRQTAFLGAGLGRQRQPLHRFPLPPPSQLPDQLRRRPQRRWGSAPTAATRSYSVRGRPSSRAARCCGALVRHGPGGNSTASSLASRLAAAIDL
jgi:hypothetical protein